MAEADPALRSAQRAFPMIGVPVDIGEVVAGTYRIEGMLGEGAMGVVTVARHQTLGHRVAIKFLHPHIARQTHAAERFRREARTAASIRGAHTCRVLDVGTHGNGLPYLVMEHLEGHTLADELHERGLLPYREAVGYVLEACEGLAEAHARGIVHRDIKPANLFLETQVDGTRSIKVLDFGVSKSLATTVGRLTTSMNLLGSPLYCSPEHLRSAHDLDARSDIWSLGVVLYELLTGLLPFDADSLPQLLHAVLSNPIPPPQTLGIDVPLALTAVLERALAKDPDQRYASVAELASALVPFAAVEAEASQRAKRMLAVSGGGVTPPYLTTPTVAYSAQRDASPFQVTQRIRAPMSARRWVALALALVLGTGVLAYASTRITAEAPARAPQDGHAASAAKVPTSTAEEHAPAATERAPTPTEPAAPPAPTGLPAAGSHEADPRNPASKAPTQAAEPDVPREAVPKRSDAAPASRPHPAAMAPPPEEAEPAATPEPSAPSPATRTPVPFRVSDFGGRH